MVTVMPALTVTVMPTLMVTVMLALTQGDQTAILHASNPWNIKGARCGLMAFRLLMHSA
jgi:hypothetical protein